MTSKTRARWTSLGIIVGTLLLIAAIASAFWVQQGRIDAGAHRYDNLSAKYDRLFTQYSRLYGDCAESTSCEPTAPAPEAIPGPQGTAGASGPSGATGARGEKGDIGVPGQTGPKGETGATGSEGAAGPAGAQGDPGPAGAQGPAGATGATGPAGAAGVPPLSWTYTDPLGIPYSCTRTDPFDPTAPTYSCAPTPIGDQQ
jgi:hypothetical protein